MTGGFVPAGLIEVETQPRTSINHTPSMPNENTVSFAAELLITFPQKLTHDAETHKFLPFSPHKGAVLKYNNVKLISRVGHGRRGIIFGATTPVSRLN